ARAMAKDAPIIVADEPTGNLDSASAEAVMETLAKVARDKLVVIVTHNYEQAEPYVTRKLTSMTEKSSKIRG
ncbi:MAG: ABC transporter ATP-binding protein, partial [Mogibacterium sp.]|nr:ABC transporter ATP-binding protein [Mogibacterium sp.]